MAMADTLNAEQIAQKMRDHALELRRKDIDLDQAVPQIQKLADDLGWARAVGHRCTAREATLAFESAVELDVNVRGFHHTDSGNAELFAHLNKGKICYDHKRGRWLIWRKHWWVEDTTGRVYQLAKDAARIRLQAATKLEDDHARREEAEWALKSESRFCIHAMLDSAKNEPLIADDGEHWDADPMLLGVRNGVVDLQTGKLRDGRPEDQISKHINIAFDPTAECPRWEKFLEEVFGNDPEMLAYIHRLVGYCLTGSTKEQCILLGYGEGSNGKGVLMETMYYILKPYAKALPFSALEKKARSSIPNDVAEMAGMRFIIASETDEETALNTSRIKALTGEDTQSGRFLYENLFEFESTAKVLLAFNRKPVIRDPSHGMWRRVHLIPFEQTFEDKEAVLHPNPALPAADKNLKAKLRAEAPGILAWGVRGCLEWQQHGLGKPPKIVAATEAYREESDHLGHFLDQCCIVYPTASVPPAALWERYQDWCKGKEVPLGRKTFNSRLEACGYKRVQMGREWGFRRCRSRFRSDRDERSGIDPISPRSEATLVVAFLEK
jgi:putative DNA primase/helicase